MTRDEGKIDARYSRRLFLTAAVSLVLYIWWELPGGSRGPTHPLKPRDTDVFPRNRSLATEAGAAVRSKLAASIAAEMRGLDQQDQGPAPAFCPAPDLHRQPAMPAARPHTPVIYVYHHRGPEHAARAAAFARLALQSLDGTTLRLVVPWATRHLLEPSLPSLPNNTAWVELPEDGCVASTWGMLGAALPFLDLPQTLHHVVVVDSYVAGPFLPSHVRQHLHWTTPFVSKLRDGVKMVGSMISCEGAPFQGNASAEWRRNPHVLPHAWATDQTGWQLLTAPEAGVLECRQDLWDVRWFSDVGAGRAMLEAGHGLDSLMLRLPPDRQRMNDGITVSPQEVIFWPLALAQAEMYVELRAGLRYANWSQGPADVAPNLYLGRPDAKQQVVELEWSVRGEIGLALRTTMGGDACLDHERYALDPAMAALRTSCFMGSCGFSLFDHYMLLGVFQGRPAAWTCPAPGLTRDQRVALAAAAGRACFDDEHYRATGPDLGALQGARELWEHYVLHGQFEGRTARWTCGGAMPELRAAADGTPASALWEEQHAILATLPRPSTRGAVAAAR